MEGDAGPVATQNIRFGPFVLRPTERILERDGQRVPLGGRAFDILMILVERAGEVVSQKLLYERVWPGLNVSEVSLRVQIRALRLALGADDGGATYVSNIPARGYCFVAPVLGTLRALPVETPPPPTAPHTDLPRPVDAFVGRESELTELDDSLRAQRLITLVGPGGIGKSRLAVELGWRLCERFPDGVWFVDLAPVAKGDFVASAVATAIGGDLRSTGGAAEALAAFIGGRRALLILDNCERLIRPIAELTNVLMQKTLALSILATSLQPIGIAGEHIYRLHPLDLPPPGESDLAGHHSAVALFVERARETDHTFSLTAENALTVGEVCRRLDGVPLALEMAVARLPLLGLQGLRQGLDERLRMLAPRRRLSLSRHSSLRNMVEWSYDLLDPAAARLFRRLAIFAGSFSLDAAVAVGGSDEIDDWDTLDALGGLIDRSLVIAEPVEPPRYRLLETLRLFASEQLQASGENDLCSSTHATFYCDLLENIFECDETQPDEALFSRYGDELDNVRSAIDWALADHSRSYIATTLGGGLFLLLRLLNLYSDARIYYERFQYIFSSQPPSTYLARLLRESGDCVGKGDVPLGAMLLRRSINLYEELGNPLFIAWSKVPLAYLCVQAGNLDEGDALIQSARPVLDDSNFTSTRIRAVMNEGIIATFREEAARAKERFYTALELARSYGKVALSCSIYINLSIAEYSEGNFERAAEVGKIGLDIASSTRHRRTLHISLNNQSKFLCLAGDLAGARLMAERLLPLVQAAGDWSVRECVLVWVLLLASEGYHNEAAQLYGFVREAHARTGTTPALFSRVYERIGTIFSENLSPDEQSAHARIGAAWTADQALTFALGAGRTRALGHEPSNFGEPAPSERVGRRSADLDRSSSLH